MSLQLDNSLTTPEEAFGIDRLRLRFRDPSLERRYLTESLNGLLAGAVQRLTGKGGAFPILLPS